MDTPKPIRYEVTRVRQINETRSIIIYAADEADAEALAAGTPTDLWSDADEDVQSVVYRAIESPMEEEKG